LYSRYHDSAEGDLTRVRAHLVREEHLHRLALELELPSLVRLSEGEAKGGGAQRPSILADALEALIGAVFIDAGYEAAAGVVQRLFGPLIDSADLSRWTKDPKTELQEWLQGRRLPVPAYRIVATRGQAHAQTFEVECAVSALAMTESGQGRSRRAAEQEAARRLLDQLKLQDGPEGSVPA
jgi:ribonuclease-3